MLDAIFEDSKKDVGYGLHPFSILKLEPDTSR